VPVIREVFQGGRCPEAFSWALATPMKRLIANIAMSEMKHVRVAVRSFCILHSRFCIFHCFLA
jgi:hypothetical protein